MKRFFLLLLPTLFLVACAQDDATTVADGDTLVPDDVLVAEVGTVVGEDPGDGPVIFADEVVMHPEQYENAPVRVAGTVSEVCQQAGCWFTFQNEAGVAFRVKVPSNDGGYVFTFPTDVSGRQAVVEGMLTVEETDVETLRHLAQDKGASEEELAAITAPERTLVLTATGARLQSDGPQNA